MYNQSDYDALIAKRSILKKLFGTIGANVAVDIPFYCDYGKNIHIGSNVTININCTLADSNKIEIGSNALIASNVIYNWFSPYTIDCSVPNVIHMPSHIQVKG